MDWRGVTAEWVREGLITETQRDPLLRWLTEHAPPNRWLTERVLPALVALALWLLSGSAYLVAAGSLGGEAVQAAFAVVGVLQVAAGALAASRGQGGVAVGAVSAGFVVLTLSTARWPTSSTASLLYGAALAAAGTVAAVWLRSRGVALAAVGAATWAALQWLGLPPDLPEAAATVIVALGWLFTLAALFRRYPWALPADPAALFPTLLLVRLAWEATAGPGALGSAMACGALGLVLLGLGAASESVGFVAAGVAAFAFAEGGLLSAATDPTVAVAVLGGEGVLLLVGVAVFVAWPAGRRRRTPPS